MTEADKIRLGRKKLPDSDRRSRQITTYVSLGEETAVALLATDYPFDSQSDVIRRALAVLVSRDYPELLHHIPPALHPKK